MYVADFRDLEVYKLARKLANEIFEITKKFPSEERYSLSSQIRRSSRSVGAQIPEAWAKRRYKAHFIAKLTDSDGEQRETQHWIETALDCDYIDTNTRNELIGEYNKMGRMLQSMIDKADKFCNKNVGKL